MISLPLHKFIDPSGSWIRLRCPAMGDQFLVFLRKDPPLHFFLSLILHIYVFRMRALRVSLHGRGRHQIPLGFELQTSGRAAVSALKVWAISPAPTPIVFLKSTQWTILAACEFCPVDCHLNQRALSWIDSSTPVTADCRGDSAVGTGEVGGFSLVCCAGKGTWAFQVWGTWYWWAEICLYCVC